MSGCLIEEMEPVGDDVLYGAEITSNRPDLLGTIGIAREVSALTGAPLTPPPVDFPTAPDSVESLASVEVPAPDLCPRYTARLIRGVKIGPSPEWLRKRLEALRLRCVNNVVDVTNYILFECGQPLHAFDFDKLSGGRIIVRRANEGEKLISIDGTECALKSSMLIIADAERPVAIAGIMGGLDTEISDRTVNVLLESACFENTQIRRTSRALMLASDSSYRFERGVDPVQTEWASRRAARLIQEVAGGEILQGVLDVWAKPYEPKEVALRYQRLNHLLGMAVPPDAVRAILARLGFNLAAKPEANRVTVLVPPWRAQDVYREADLIEEVIRIYGYDKIPESATLPVTVGRVNKFEKISDRVRDYLPGLGFNEALTNSFVDEPTSKLVSPWTDTEALLVQNTIRRDENRLRVSLLPGLLAVKHTNLAHGVPESPFFEISRVFLAKPPRTEGEPSRDDALPIEKHVLTLMTEEDILTLKGSIEGVLKTLGIASRAVFEEADLPFFASGRCARILLDGALFGVIGEVSRPLCDQYDINRAPVMAELDFDLLVEKAELDRRYRPLPAYPAAERDLAVVVDESLPWGRIESAIGDLKIPILETIRFFDVFRGKQVPAGKKSIAFSLTFRAPDRTLTSEEIEEARQAAIRALEALGGQLRGYATV
jgi:phenylalanyl-tRNA synthetase beta chain